MLLTQLIGALKEEVLKSKHSAKVFPAWHNFIYIAYMVEELVLGSVKEITSRARERDFKGQPLFKWVHDEGYLLYYYGSNEKSLWAEWSMLESLFTTVDAIYPEWCLKVLAQSIDRADVPYVESVFSLLEKAQASEDLNSILELLLQDSTPYKAQQNPFQQPPAPQTQKSSKKSLLSNVLGLKLSSSSQPVQ